MTVTLRLFAGAMRRTVCGILVIGFALLTHQGAAGGIPFVGCPLDGQTGPIPAPKKDSVPPLPASVSAKMVARLAYYRADFGELGVFAPKGWHCFGLYGSSGSQLVVMAKPPASRNLFKAIEHIDGPAIHLSLIEGGTSGRFEVARIVARVFPIAQDFVEQVVAEGIEEKSAFPQGPYPTDIIVRHGPTSVDFVTPAGQEGMGTHHSWLPKGDQPITGSILLFPDDDMDARVLAFRLPPESRDLGTVIQATFRPD
ncbi:hypothetical protein [Nitrospirillum iridis]|uniref:Uncharacterized protein n=1 Tax=Nitrospirillum iridis TaxID=765888 RepID=A0A7X0EE77_9PROT|nr:hypothetical protein [Nitrospirillum iridis]MBB6253573.1 hypothetical protein [Nitrospirillum iridis]